MKQVILLFLIFTDSVLLSQTFEIIGPPANQGNIIKFQGNNSEILYIGNGSGALTRSINDGNVKEYLHPGIDISGSRQIVLLNQDTSSIFFNSGGYLFRTSDTGESWDYEDGEPYAEAFITVNPLNDSIIYKYKGNELFKSYDKGLNWHYLHDFGSTIYDVKIAYTDTNVIYVATYLALYKSTDTGINWFNPVVSPIAFSPREIIINYSNHNTLYVFDSAGYGWSVSKDGGINFNPFGPPAYKCVQHPQDTLTFYFTSYAPVYHTNGLFVKSTDEGQTWFSVNEDFPEEIYFDPPSINPLNGEELYVSSGIGIYKSTDGGENWNEVFIAAAPVIFGYHIDSDNPDKIITTNSAYGFKMTSDAGKTWFIPIIDTIAPSNNNFYYDFAFNPQNANQGFLTSDQALYQTLDGGLSWTKNNFPYNRSRSITISPVNPDIMLLCTIDSPEGSANLYRSTDGGNSWELRKSLGGWYNGFFKMIFHPTDINKVYFKIHTGDSLVVSTDQGLTWTNTGEGLSEDAYITHLWINPINTLEMYCSEGDAGTNSGVFSMSTNGGESWFQIDSSLKVMDASLDVQGFWIDPDNTNRMYVGLGEQNQFPTSDYTSGGLYFTDNHGKSWIKIFDSAANIIKADNSKPKNIYFNTKYGLLRIKDTLVTSINESPYIKPNSYVLSQNYPNPFNPSTTINFSIPERSFVTLKVYDMLGRETAELVNEEFETGNFEKTFDASSLSSGVYIYRITAMKEGKILFNESKQMLLIK